MIFLGCPKFCTYLMAICFVACTGPFGGHFLQSGSRAKSAHPVPRPALVFAAACSSAGGTQCSRTQLVSLEIYRGISQQLWGWQIGQQLDSIKTSPRGSKWPNLSILAGVAPVSDENFGFPETYRQALQALACDVETRSAAVVESWDENGGNKLSNPDVWRNTHLGWQKFKGATILRYRYWFSPYQIWIREVIWNRPNMTCLVKHGKARFTVINSGLEALK